jgi:hypothetical protein
MSKFVTTKDIVIPAGTEVDFAPVRTEYFTRHGEALIGFDKDTTGSLRFDWEEAEQLGLIRERADG